jgi:hypothetical protein
MWQPYHGRPILAYAIKESRISIQLSNVAFSHARIDSCCTVTWKYAITINRHHSVAILLLMGHVENNQKSGSQAVTSVEPPRPQKLADVIGDLSS